MENKAEDSLKFLNSFNMDIQLRLLQEGDLEKVRDWRNSPEVAQYMYTEEHITKEQQKVWFNSIRDDKFSKYWIIEYDNKSLGLASLTNINSTTSSCYWAFYLGDTTLRGAGIGSKVEFNILRYVFEELNLNKLRCEVLISNPKVVSMHEKFGFRREAYYRQHIKKNGVFHDVIGLAMLNQEWKAIKSYMEGKIYRR